MPRAKRRPIVPALAAVAAVVLTMAMPTASASAAASVVTPAQAIGIAIAYDVANNRANATFDTALQDKHEEGAARAEDDALFRIARRVGAAPFPQFTPEGLRVYVARQTTYPATFVAFSHPKSPGSPTPTYTYALVFQKDSAAAPWRLANGVAFPGAAPTFTVGLDGYLPAVVPSSLIIAPSRLTTAWIHAQDVAGHGGQAPSVWTRTAMFKQFIAISPAAAVDDRVTAGSSGYPPLCFAAAAGAVCFLSTTSTRDESLTSAEIAEGEGYRISTVDDQTRFGGLAQGVYSRLHLLGQRDVAIIVPEHGGAGGLAVAGVSGQSTGGTGVAEG